jgi:hypothetical protein
MDDSPFTPDSSSDSAFDHVGSHDHGTGISDQADTHHGHLADLNGPDPLFAPGSDDPVPSRNKRRNESKPGIAFIPFIVVFIIIMFLVFRYL